MGDNSRPQTTGYPAYPYPSPYPDPRTTFFRRLLAVVIATGITLGTILFIVWLVLRPRLLDFRANSVALSDFNTSTSPSRITGNWNVSLTAFNPNSKIRLYYDQMDAGLFYKDEEIARATLPSFTQGRKNQTTLGVNFTAAGSYVSRWVVDDINRNRTKGSVSFNVRLAGLVRFKVGFWRARKRWVRVYCGDLRVGLMESSGNASLVGGGGRGCRVGF